MQISFSLCICFDTCTSPTIHLLCPPPPPPPLPQFCVAFVFNSLGCYSRPKENLRHCSCKIFLGGDKVYYGRCASGELCYLIYQNRTHVVCFKLLALTIPVTTIYKLLLLLIRERMFIFSFMLPSPQMTPAVAREKTDHLSRQESLTMESLILPHPPAFLPHHPLDFK